MKKKLVAAPRRVPTLSMSVMLKIGQQLRSALDTTYTPLPPKLEALMQRLKQSEQAQKEPPQSGWHPSATGDLQVHYYLGVARPYSYSTTLRYVQRLRKQALEAGNTALAAHYMNCERALLPVCMGEKRGGEHFVIDPRCV